MPEFKEGKKYVVAVTTSFVGEFKRTVKDPKTGEEIAVFATGGSGRYGEYERSVKTSTIVSSELTKTHA